MQGGGAKHSLSYWNRNDNNDDDKYDEDDNNDDDDIADGDYTQNSRKSSFSLRYLEQNLLAKTTWMRLYISHLILYWEQIFIRDSLKSTETIKTHLMWYKNLI